jgi:D-3-phosphoglycerate dehydrogenase / 2-oxoglutarate reductase
VKILVNDGLGKKGVLILEGAGFEVDTETKNEKELIQVIGNYDGLIIRSATKVTGELLEAGAPPNGRLKIVVRAGVGVDNIDLGSAACCGVVVKNAPSGNTNATAELALGLMLSASRHISLADRQLQSGQWRKKDLKGIELSGKTLGIIGCGRVGQRLSEITSGFMNVIGYDMDPETVQSNFPNSRITYKPIDQVLEESDYISVHVTGNKEILGPEEFKKLKKGVILINVSRGKNINKACLCEALEKGEVFGAGIDVHEDEPGHGGEFFCASAQIDRCNLTPHIGASTYEAQENVAIETGSVMRNYLLKGSFYNAVNIRDAEKTTSYQDKLNLLFVFHKNEPGVFGPVATVLGNREINMKDIVSGAFICNNGDEKKAMTVIRAYDGISPDVIKEVESLDTVYWARAL